MELKWRHMKVTNWSSFCFLCSLQSLQDRIYCFLCSSQGCLVSVVAISLAIFFLFVLALTFTALDAGAAPLVCSVDVQVDLSLLWICKNACNGAFILVKLRELYRLVPTIYWFKTVRKLDLLISQFLCEFSCIWQNQICLQDVSLQVKISKSGSFAFKFLVFIATEHTDFITSVLLELSCLLDYPFYMYAGDAQHPNK